MFFGCNVVFSSLPPFLPSIINEYEFSVWIHYWLHTLIHIEDGTLRTRIPGSICPAVPYGVLRRPSHGFPL